MTSNELRKKFLDFFKTRGHKIVPSSSLLPKDDPSVLITAAGMQQFKSYYLGKKSPFGNRTASCQKCFRTSDIEEVGDASHLTFFEMLGNFSFAYPEGEASYFKKEAIEFAYDFIVKELGLKIDFVSVFGGDEEIPEDNDCVKIWLSLGMPKEKIKKFGRKDNFWGPTGDEGPCGPTTEIYVDGIEIWNLVFNEFYQSRDKVLTPLKQKGVDTGMGLERLAMAVQGKPTVFETDLYFLIIDEISKMSALEYNLEPSCYRIIADHLKAAVFLISDGIMPSNITQGYILRRLLRRAIRHAKVLNLPDNFYVLIVKKIADIYKEEYSDIMNKESDIITVIQNEAEKFQKTLDKGLKELEKLHSKGEITGSIAFDMYQTYGFPLEMTKEELKIKGRKIKNEEEFEEKLKKHQEISRIGAAKKFGGHGLADHKEFGLKYKPEYHKEDVEKITKLHTATHLLHQALRVVLGTHVKQMGSDINPERLRFDFSHPQKMTAEEIKKVEDLVNEKISEALDVKYEEMSYEEAIKSGALAFFKERYPERVTVYFIGKPSTGSGRAFSAEICGGPHIKNTSELGHFKIIKEESSSAGVRRIKGVLQ